jgi:hypothetical protein
MGSDRRAQGDVQNTKVVLRQHDLLIVQRDAQLHNTRTRQGGVLLNQEQVNWIEDQKQALAPLPNHDKAQDAVVGDVDRFA